MKQTLLCGLIVFAIGLGVAFTGTAQNNVPSASVPSSIGVIDLMKILNEWTYVTTRVQDLTLRYKPRIDAINTRVQELQKQAQKLNELKPGSTEFQQLQNELVRQEQGIKLDQGLLQKEHSEEEAKIYQEAYKFIKSHTAYFAQKRGISCVLQTSTTPEFQISDPRMSVAQMTRAELVTRQVIWSDTAIDLTPLVLQQLNSARSNNSASAARTGAAANTAAAPSGAAR